MKIQMLQTTMELILKQYIYQRQLRDVSCQTNTSIYIYNETGTVDNKVKYISYKINLIHLQLVLTDGSQVTKT